MATHARVMMEEEVLSEQVPSKVKSKSSSYAVHSGKRTGGAKKKSLHRIHKVRRQQGMSLRTAARQLGDDIREIRRQEDESTDLLLSDLYKWQAALEVPLSELLEEPKDTLSPPVMERARLVRMMKTAVALLERASNPGVQRLARMLVDQLIDAMPELEGVGPWHSVGQRRTLDDYGRIVEQQISDDLFCGSLVE